MKVRTRRGAVRHSEEIKREGLAAYYARRSDTPGESERASAAAAAGMVGVSLEALRYWVESSEIASGVRAPRDKSAQTPSRSFRLPTLIREAIEERADRDGVTVNQILLGACRAYAEGETSYIYPRESRP